MFRFKKRKHNKSLVLEDWHSFKEADLFEELNSKIEGLDTEEVDRRLNFYGKNQLPEGKKITIFEIILNQLINPLIFILILAAIASIAIGEAKDAIFIFIVIALNSAIGTFQEYNAEKSAESLKNLLKIKARVRRDNKEQEIFSEFLVPGDIVILESGFKVPADLRLLSTTNLTIDESFLTGESIPVKKEIGILRKNIPISERTNLAFAGSTVITGRGIGIVTGTGLNTQVGLIAQEVTESQSAKPPLILRMEKFIKQITIIISFLSVIIAIALRVKGMDYASIFFSVVALAVSAIPEGLPVALTVALSVATKRMAKRNVIVRRLTSVESLGSCTVIASDKTGTLTVNEQTAKKIILPDDKIFSISGEGYNGSGKIYYDENFEKEIDIKTEESLEIINEISVLANEASLTNENGQWMHYGDAMDVALLGMSYKLGITPSEIRSKYSLVDIIPYESEQKYSAAIYSKDSKIFAGAKGAVEIILGFCNKMFINKKLVPINSNLILKQAENIAKEGYRVLAIAGGELKGYKKNAKLENFSNLVFYGLVCFIDPLRPEASESVQKCKKAGIKVIMITGDHPSTAAKIARELGIADYKTKVVTGNMLLEIGSPDSPAYEKLVNSSSVFARVSPTQKLEIVDVLIRSGEFVAVTGDGVNDAPALKRANIGVAMGSGTDVAKEVGSIIVTDDNFASIVAGIEEGRFAYDNVRKVIYLLISTGAAEIILFLLSIAAGLPIPLLAVQLLWLNLVTNGIQDVALAFEGGEPNTLEKKPRKPTEKIFNPLMIKQTLFSSATIGVIVFSLWYWLNNYTTMTELHARDLILLLMVFMQNFHVFNCRSETTSTFKVPISRNYLLIVGVILAQGVHILSMQIPFMQDILKIEPISFNEWIMILTLAIPILVVMEIFKFFNNKIEQKKQT